MIKQMFTVVFLSLSFVTAEEIAKCYPQCRTGFICNQEGVCVSECNPPCPSEYICSNGDCIKNYDTQKILSQSNNPYGKEGVKIGVWGTLHIAGLAMVIAGTDETTKGAGAVISIFAIPFIAGGIVETVKAYKWESAHK